MANAKSNSGFDSKLLRNALGSYATGVTIITADDGNGIRAGLTANSFSSVSLNPSLVSSSLANHAPGMPIFQDCSHYTINVLKREQEDLENRYSQPRDNKFDGVKLTQGLGNSPTMTGALATFQCRNAIATWEEITSYSWAPLKNSMRVRAYCRSSMVEILAI
ncbi:MAG: flavin reductase family protein [Rhizobiaceae bacterium]